MWATQLQFTLNVDSGRALDRIFNGDRYHRTAGSLVRTNQFQRYLRGVTVPRDLPLATPTVELVEQQFPGTAAIFRTPIWDAVKGRPLNRTGIVTALASLNRPLADAITRKDPSGGPARLRPIDQQLLAMLEQLDGYDVFEATVLLVVLATLNGDALLREELVAIYNFRRRDHAQGKLINLFYSKLYPLTDRVCRPRWFTPFGEVIEIDYPWTAEFRTLDGMHVPCRMFPTVTG